MLGQTKIRHIANQVLSVSQADQTEMVVIASDMGLTRFANNQIHQNLVRKDIHVNLRVVESRKIGVASGNLNFWQEKLAKKDLKRIVDQALLIAKNQKSDPDFVSLPGPAKYPKIASFSSKTVSFSPADRAKQAGKIIKQAQTHRLLAFGAFQTGINEIAVANSKGIFAYFPETFANLNVTMMGKSRSGYAAQMAVDVNKIKPEEIAQKSAQKTLFAGRRGLISKPEIELPAGRYEVVLEPSAVNQMLLYLAYLGFGARSFHEGRSFISGKLGKKVVGDDITIWDDALDVAGFPIPFDFEGVPKKRLSLIKKGIAKNVAYDSYLAGKYGQQSTGHGLLAPNTLDALASHLRIKPGEKSTTELISEVKRGILVSRLWYVNAHHHNLVITGLTRDGTFLIEKGEIVAPIKDMRITQSIPQALSKVTGISKEVKVEESWAGANLVPVLRIADFNFTGVSKLL